MSETTQISFRGSRLQISINETKGKSMNQCFHILAQLAKMFIYRELNKSTASGFSVAASSFLSHHNSFSLLTSGSASLLSGRLMCFHICTLPCFISASSALHLCRSAMEAGRVSTPSVQTPLYVFWVSGWKRKRPRHQWELETQFTARTSCREARPFSSEETSHR